ncbi:MAG: GTP cyclohydrolase II [Acetobacteraceae bacterium]|nr:GTP cyclohydrolase II [Acetobacteraceae bacterium]
MTYLPLRGDFAPEPAADAERLQSVRQAALAMRAGRPVIFRATAPQLILAAETADQEQIALWLDQASARPVLLLTPVRAAAVLRRPVPGHPVALRLPAGQLTPDGLRRLADPVEDAATTDATPDAEAPDHAAASLLLAKLAHLLPAVLSVPLSPAAAEAARRSGVAVVAAEDVKAAPDGIAASLRRVAEARVPLEGAEDARVVAFRAVEAGVDHLAILIGKPETAEAPLVRLHSECFTGDLLGSLRCDCGPQLRGAIRRMAGEGAGVLLYLAQEGRGIGLANKLRAYALQDRGLDTLDANRALGFEPDERSFAVAAAMLHQLGVTRLRLLTNNPDKLAALSERGIEVVGRAGHAVAPNGINDSYLATKARRFGHLLG